MNVTRLVRPRFLLLPLLAAAGAVTQAACSRADDDDAVGSVEIAITQVPMDVRCIRLTATGSRMVVKKFDVFSGQSSILTMNGLPIGLVEFKGDAFPGSCGVVAPTDTPNWLSESVLAQVGSGPPALVTLAMRRNGRARVDVDFQDDPACFPEGAMCSANAQCCNGSCDNGVCRVPQCRPQGATCQANAPCCTGLACDMATLTCRFIPPMCQPNGAMCRPDIPCCSGCTNGVCGGQTCRPDSSACVSSAECCSGSCQFGVCRPPGMCQPAGAPCNPNAPCCSGSCDATGRCSPPGCRSDGGPCMLNAECCSGSCQAGVCRPPNMCQPDGAQCRPDIPCCSGCSANGACGGPICRPDGNPCMTSPECCSGSCQNFVCQPPNMCPPPGAQCQVDSECCAPMLCLLDPMGFRTCR